MRISVILCNTFGRCSECETNIITTHIHTTICHPKSHLQGTYTYIYSDTGPRRGLPYTLVETWRLALCAPLRPPQWIRAGAAAGQSARRKAARRAVSVIAEVVRSYTCAGRAAHPHTAARENSARPGGRAGGRANSSGGARRGVVWGCCVSRGCHVGVPRRLCPQTGVGVSAGAFAGFWACGLHTPCACSYPMW